MRDSEDKAIYAEYENEVGMLERIINTETPGDFDFEPFDKYLKCIYGTDCKFIWSSNGLHEFYDMRKDWNEEENIISGERDKASNLLNQLKIWHDSLWIPTFKGKTNRMDEKTREALKSLGYIK